MNLSRGAAPRRAEGAEDRCAEPRRHRRRGAAELWLKTILWRYAVYKCVKMLMLIAFSPNNVLLYMSRNTAFIHVIIVLAVLWFFKSAKLLGAPGTLGAPGLCPAQLIGCDATAFGILIGDTF